MENSKTIGRNITRRKLLTGGAALAAVSLGGCAQPSGPSLNLDLNDPWDRLTALAKLRGSIDGAIVMCCLDLHGGPVLTLQGFVWKLNQARTVKKAKIWVTVISGGASGLKQTVFAFCCLVQLPHLCHQHQ